MLERLAHGIRLRQAALTMGRNWSLSENVSPVAMAETYPDNRATIQPSLDGTEFRLIACPVDPRTAAVPSQETHPLHSGNSGPSAARGD